MNRIKGLIFDLDGTLLDSMWVWAKIDVEFLGKRGIPVPGDYIEKIAPMGFLNAAKYTIERFLLNETVEEIEEEWLNMAEEAYAHSIQMKPYAKEFLDTCKTLGYPMAIATSSQKRLYEPCLKNHGVLDYFSCIVTTLEIGVDKRSPLIYQTAAGKMGLHPENCMVFEDIHAGIIAAKRAGFLVTAVEDRNTQTTRSNRQQIRKEADVCIADFYRIAEKLKML